MTETRSIQRYGWKPSLPDLRDQTADTNGLNIVPEVDPRHEQPDPYDQSQLGSCTANAIAGSIEYNCILDGKPFGTPSRLDIYYGERMIEGDLGQGDTGAFGRDGFKFAHSTGVIPEADWPYDINKYAKKPPDDVAHRFKIGSYKAVPRNKSAMQAVLTNKQTIAFGFTVYESFESDGVAHTGVVPVPARGEQVLGGHEVLLIGYLKNEPGYALCRNSWGTNWGLGGYFLMPWTILMNSHMSSDFRTIYRPAA